MNLKRLAVGACLMILASAVPAAAGSDGSIVLRGRGNSYIDIELSTPVTIEFPSDPDAHFEASSNGDFVGFAVQRLPDRKLLVGGVWAKPLDLLDGRVPATFAFRPKAHLGPGRYRFILLGQERSFWGGKGSASVVIPAKGLRGTLVYEPGHKADVEWRVGDAQFMPGQPATLLNAPIDVRRSSTTLIAVSQESDYGQLSYAGICLTPAGTICEQTEDPQESMNTWVTPGAAGSGMIASRIYRPGKLEPAAYEAQVRTAAIGWTTKLYSFLLQIN